MTTIEFERNRTEFVETIERLDSELLRHFRNALTVEPSLNREKVSFQGNKHLPMFRLYKYKEAFSSTLVDHFLKRFEIKPGSKVLDPFAGVGTTLFACSAQGIDSFGVEVLPVGQEVIKSRMLLEQLGKEKIRNALSKWIKERPWETANTRKINAVRITQGAYPANTEIAIGKFLSAIETEAEDMQKIFKFVLLSVLESISYTRKDGQYLRWDYRSGRCWGKKKFDKGKIKEFDEAIIDGMRILLDDLSYSKLGAPDSTAGHVTLYDGSCFDIMPKIDAESIDLIFTSPPYCNRYDYTRTYALELALLGVKEDEFRVLRQSMLSSTVENKPKGELIWDTQWRIASDAADETELLQQIIAYLENGKKAGELNNTGIPRMIKGYFYEMALVIAHAYRVLERGGRFVMVNDNVRYQGINIPVDLILSNIAEKIGFQVERIFVLPETKGNSSQQMGNYGKNELRKCVYSWKKEAEDL